MSANELRDLIQSEQALPAPAGAILLAEEFARRSGKACVAVLYYGSTLRDASIEGILDFYVLLDDVAAWPGSLLSRLANRVLPPNVGYCALPDSTNMLRAKFAVMSLQQFAQRMAVESFDTTVWARFCQPSLCIWSRSEADRSKIAALIGEAVVTAATWSAWLGPESGTAAQYWSSLFARTYAAELRVEKTSRPQDIVNRQLQRYSQLLPLAWQAAGLSCTVLADGRFTPQVTPAAREQAEQRWQRRQRWGPRLNILRLLKAAFTFEGAMDYVAWKIERHSGVRIEVSPWQRRFPLLAAPGLYWKLRRQGILR